MKQLFNKIFLVDFFKNIKYFLNWYTSNFISPAPNFVKHKIIKHFLIKDSILIETGTNEGKHLESYMRILVISTRLNHLNITTT